MNSPFSTSRGKMLADQLVKEIGKSEAFQNIDECIDYIREELCSYSDDKAGAPVSAFLKAEDLNRLSSSMTSNRYKIEIMEA